MSQVSVVEVPLVPVLACWGSRQWSCGILWGQMRHFLARHRLPIFSCSPIWHISLQTRFVFRIHQFISHRFLEKMPPPQKKIWNQKTCVKTHEILWRSWRGTEISWNLGTQRAFGMSLRNNAINAARHEFDFPQTNLSIHFIGGVCFPDFWKMTPRARRIFFAELKYIKISWVAPLINLYECSDNKWSSYGRAIITLFVI